MNISKACYLFLDTKITDMIELTDKELKRAITNMFRYLKENKIIKRAMEGIKKESNGTSKGKKYSM